MDNVQMKILGITDKRYLKATMEVVGSEADLLISPPLCACCIAPEHLQGYEFIYIDLHGEEGEGVLYHRNEIDGIGSALSVETVRLANMGGTVVFATSCYLPSTPFIEAFLEAGARAVIAGEGENYGKLRRMSGAQVLAKNLIKELNPSLSPHNGGRNINEALENAKGRMKGLMRVFDKRGVEDSLEFKLYDRDGGGRVSDPPIRQSREKEA